MGRKKSPYKMANIKPYDEIEKGFNHREYYAYIFRWAFICRVTRSWETIVDFGCGQGGLVDTLYRNRLNCLAYYGLDINDRALQVCKDKYSKLEWAHFIEQDIVKPGDYFMYGADKVISFKVIENTGKGNAGIFLENFKACGNETATYYLSAPNLLSLKDEIESRFEVIEKFGTYAKQIDYKELLNDWQIKMFDAIHSYYNKEIVSIMMAPMFPEHSNEILWVLKAK